MESQPLIITRQGSSTGPGLGQRETCRGQLVESYGGLHDFEKQDPRIDYAPSDQPEAPLRDISGWKWYRTLLPVIVEEFGDIQKLSWLSAAFRLCAPTTSTSSGSTSSTSPLDHLWRDAVHDRHDLGRAIAAATTTLAERPVYVSCTGFTWGFGIVLGPAISPQWAGMAFYISRFIGAVYGPFYLFLIPSKDPRPGASIRRVLTALILAINLGGITHPWDAGRIVALFAVAGVLFILLCVQQAWNIDTTLLQRIIPVHTRRLRGTLCMVKKHQLAL
ncbi:hypothetical protein EYZ11_005736 [Aspergillus tanneri]|uniref:Major facilitator superfamily (MFS) profile domain-containing protein n=1 Tax=Aspergillus tanneri TaxID=1220188 RepID=A0A4S3JHQ1_9EURO|nr:hypothetical protein EYZ11_005736 [Aspergillus tanneri]